MMRWVLIAILACASSVCAQDAVRIDSVADESLLSVRADAKGRLFVGGREALFVYEPNGKHGYHAHKLLYRFPANSHLNDIEIRGNDLFVLTQSALYVIPGGVRKRENLQPRKLLWGVPRGDARQGFRACAWGPEGDLYLALGAERWGYWTFFSGKAKTPYHGGGAVLRCKPDGSGLEVVARGLRHPDGLVFDRHWNLFSCDSDKENRGRLLHVTPHALFDESLQPMLDGRRTSRIAALGYRHDLIGVRGTEVLRLSIEPRGASFQATEYAWLAKKAAAVTAGPAGRLFAISPPGDLLMVPLKDDPPFEPYEVSKAAPAKLWQELSDPSWHRRYRAHVEMLRRGSDFLKDANKRLLSAKAGDPALHHLIWLAAKSGQGSLHLLSLVEHADPRVRLQAIRALTEFPEQLHDEPIFTKSLLDEHPQVQHAALCAYFAPKIAWGTPMQHAIERGPACSNDSYLRQTAALLLAEKATPRQLETLCCRSDAPMRLAGVLAVGYRLTLPAATKPLGQHLPLGKYRDESAYVIDYADGKVDLRERGRVGTYSIAEHWKANTQTEEQNRLFKLLRKMAKDPDETVRAEAARFLELLGDRKSLKSPA